MSLTLKMSLSGKSKNELGERSVSYRLDAVSGDENKPWSKYTPSGHLTFTVTNEAAPELEPGDYLVTLAKVPPPEAPPAAEAAPADEPEI